VYPQFSAHTFSHTLNVSCPFLPCIMFLISLYILLFFIFCSLTCLRPIIKLLCFHLSLLCTLRNTGRAGLRKVKKHSTRSPLYILLLVFSAFRFSISLFPTL
jgi:hypothetical protein